MPRKVKSKKKQRRVKEVGLPPGSLIYTGQHTDHDIFIEHVHYSESMLTKNEVKVQDLKNKAFNDNCVNWIIVSGINRTEEIKQIGDQFGLHPLYLEDLLNVNQRPKAEVGDNSIFVTLKYFNRQRGDLEQNQISLFVVGNTLISFLEKPTAIFDPIFKRLENTLGRLRQKNADYLLYAIIDLVVDGYYLVVSEIDEHQEEIEDRIAAENPDGVLDDTRESKKQLTQLRRAIQPLQEAVNSISHGESQVFQQATLVFINDIYDHIKQITEMVDAQIDNNRGLGDAYTNFLSNRMNEIMKVLTVISTIFIPLSFIAGLYGMNFENMPELHWQNGYFVTIGLMLLVVGGMLFYFRKKKWF